MPSEFFSVSSSIAGWRIEKICNHQFPGRTRPQWQMLLDAGDVRINGQKVRRGERPPKDAIVELTRVPPLADAWTPAFTPPERIQVLARTDRVLVVDKPPGLPTLPLHPEDSPTAAGALYQIAPEVMAVPPREAGIVNRLDNDTSGLLIVGLDPRAQECLRQRFASHRIEKVYWALVYGCFPESPQWLQGRIITQGTSRVRYEPGVGDGKQTAISHVRRLWTGDGCSLVAVTTRFGRRHQVRIQLARMGFPILNEALYDTRPRLPFDGHFLWARNVSFLEPDTDRPLRFQSGHLCASQLAFVQGLGLDAHFKDIKPFS